MSTDFDETLAIIRSYARSQFNTAKTRVDAGVANPPPGTSPDAAKEFLKQQQAEVARAQGQMAAAFAQIGDADEQERKAKGTADITALMKTTATTAAAVCVQIGSIMNTAPSSSTPQSELDARIAALSGVLDALAELSPAAFWQEPPPASGTGT
jgi:hypothetical protein